MDEPTLPDPGPTVDSTEINYLLLARYLQSKCISQKMYVQRSPSLVRSQYIIYPGVSIDDASHVRFNNNTIYPL